MLRNALEGDRRGEEMMKEQERKRWVALIIQLEQQQHEEFVYGGWWGGWVADTNYLYAARWGWINKSSSYH